MASDTPLISVIVEWENCLLSDRTRDAAILKRIVHSVATCSRPSEILFLFNPEQVDGPALRDLILTHGGGTVPLRVEEAPGLHLFELKNEGARRARGEVIAYSDSDVITSEGWLEAITSPFFSDPSIQAVSGETFVAPTSLYQKAFASGWFFPLRTWTDGPLWRHGHFYANNIAFRRTLLGRFPFPTMPEGLTRGSCVMLSKQLEKAGVPVWRNNAARASHPCPHGARHFVIRAFAQGRDAVMLARWQENPAAPMLLRPLRRMVGLFLVAWRDASPTRLRWWEIPPAAMIMAAYNTLTFAGTCFTLLFPAKARTLWRI